MAIQIKIREMAESQGIKNAYQLRIRAKLAPATASRCFSNELSLITFDTLEKLCDAFNCEPGDLFTKKKSPKKSKN